MFEDTQPASLDGLGDADRMAEFRVADPIEVKGKAISRAARIVDEGLKAGLNLEKGGRLAADLRDLYEYVSMRLVLANVRNDEAIIDECQRLIEPLRQAWKDIRPSVGADFN